MPSPDPFSLELFFEALQGAPGAIVLDLGCGTGRHAHTLSRAGFRICALDADFDALATARFLYPETESGAGLPGFCAGDAADLPFATATFDAVVCVDVLHWFKDAPAFDKAWREAWRVLRPGGILFARFRLREFCGNASGESGNPWFLPQRHVIEAWIETTGGEWLQPITQDGDSAIVLARKPAV